jgi:hypothetical protein
VQYAEELQAAVPQQQQQQQEQEADSPPPQQQPSRQQQPQPGVDGAAWKAAAAALKAQTGVPWQQMLLFAPAGAAEVTRMASRLGMCAVKLNAAAGLSVDALRSGLDAYAAKLEADRGY